MFRDTEYHTAKRLHVSINITQLKLQRKIVKLSVIEFIICLLFISLISSFIR